MRVGWWRWPWDWLRASAWWAPARALSVSQSVYVLESKGRGCACAGALGRVCGEGPRAFHSCQIETLRIFGPAILPAILDRKIAGKLDRTKKTGRTSAGFCRSRIAGRLYRQSFGRENVPVMDSWYLLLPLSTVPPITHALASPAGHHIYCFPCRSPSPPCMSSLRKDRRPALHLPEQNAKRFYPQRSVIAPSSDTATPRRPPCDHPSTHRT